MNQNERERDGHYLLSLIKLGIILFVLHSIASKYVDTRRYEVTNTSAGPMKIDHKTGQVWRYFRNPDNTEGFTAVKTRDEISAEYDAISTKVK